MFHPPHSTRQTVSHAHGDRLQRALPPHRRSHPRMALIDPAVQQRRCGHGHSDAPAVQRPRNFGLTIQEIQVAKG